MAENAYRNCNVLITGGLGFMGMNLAASLEASGARVRVLTTPAAHRARLGSPLLPRLQLLIGDLRDAELVRQAVSGCDVIFNLAAASGAAASNASPLEDADVNVRGQLILLEACRTENPGVRIVFSSSRLVYRPDLALPVAEDAPLEPSSVYGVHKLAGELYHLLYARLYGLKSSVLRITNPYGPFQRHGQTRYGVINWFIQLAVEGDALPIYGEGSQLRDYLHVDDVVRAFLKAGSDPGASGRIFNVGSGQGISLKEMAELVVRTAGRGQLRFIPWPDDLARVETGSFVADTRLIADVLKWRPAISLDQGVARAVRSYRKDAAAESAAKS